jgi:hypothetical protein
MTGQARAGGTAPTIAIVLLAASFVIQAAGRTVALLGEHASLVRESAAQAAPLRQSLKTRDQLTFLAGAIAGRAAAGDKDAAAVVQEMMAHGITLHQAPNTSLSSNRS